VTVQSYETYQRNVTKILFNIKNVQQMFKMFKNTSRTSNSIWISATVHNCLTTNETALANKRNFANESTQKNNDDAKGHRSNDDVKGQRRKGLRRERITTWRHEDSTKIPRNRIIDVLWTHTSDKRNERKTPAVKTFQLIFDQSQRGMQSLPTLTNPPIQ